MKKDLETPANFEALMAFEARYGVPPGELQEFCLFALLILP
ncbi:MAG: hypothetical protein WAX69_10945 [Victivallales bacterium]